MRTRITKSSHNDQLLMYSMSESTRWIICSISLVSPEPAHLRQTCHAGLDIVAGKVVNDILRIQGVMLQGMRPRPYQGHFPGQHIEQLWQFIKACTPDKGADPGQPWVILLRLLDHTCFRLVNMHAAKLPDTERFSCPAGTFLAEEHRPAAVNLDGQRNSQQYG